MPTSPSPRSLAERAWSPERIPSPPAAMGPTQLAGSSRRREGGGVELYAEKVSDMEVCPKCATPSRSVYDRRWVTLRDEPLRGAHVMLLIRKRRFSCATCRRPFTEPIPGVRKGYRTTDRYRRRLLWACENFVTCAPLRFSHSERGMPTVRPGSFSLQARRSPFSTAESLMHAATSSQSL